MDLIIFLTYCSLYRSCRLWESRTTRAVSAVSSVTRALTACRSLWTLKTRSTVSETTTGEGVLQENASAGPGFICVKPVACVIEKMSQCHITSEVTARPLNAVHVTAGSGREGSTESLAATCSRHMRSVFRDEENRGGGRSSLTSQGCEEWRNVLLEDSVEHQVFV